MRVRFWGVSAGLSGLVLLMALGAGCAGVGARGAPEEGPGVRIREGVGEGYRGPVSVRVEFAGDLVRNIEITDHQEDEFIGLAAMEELLALILETGFTDLDAVSGATQSSRGFLEAVEHARLSP
ncbi:MAG: FMN-binding protein [Treponema sp.]|jgi:hypothetical protein|nr:FMN-binding protein [Treponema sp.]